MSDTCKYIYNRISQRSAPNASIIQNEELPRSSSIILSDKLTPRNLTTYILPGRAVWLRSFTYFCIYRRARANLVANSKLPIKLYLRLKSNDRVCRIYSCTCYVWAANGMTSKAKCTQSFVMRKCQLIFNVLPQQITTYYVVLLLYT